MLGSFGSKYNGHSGVHPTSRQPEPTTPETAPRLPPPVGVRADVVSSIGAGMSINGNISCDHPMQIFGKIEGELRGSQVLVGDGAEIEGNVFAQELTIRGRIKGTIRATRVRLQGTGAIHGEIFHCSLSIEENAAFEGSSHRVDEPLAAGSDETGRMPKPNLRSRAAIASNGGEQRFGTSVDIEQTPL